MQKMSDNGRDAPSLNEPQLRRLVASCQYIDKLLADMEDVLNAAEAKSVFPKYSDDLSPIQHQTIQDFIGQFRGLLLRVFAVQGIESDEPKIAASHAIHSALTFIEITIEELKPAKMRGYGQVSEAGMVDLNALINELHGLAQQLHRYLRM